MVPVWLLWLWLWPAPLRAAEPPARACEQLLEALDDWSLERALALQMATEREARDLAPACAQLALAALDLQRGAPMQGVARLRGALADPSLSPALSARGHELLPRLLAAAALAGDANDFFSAHFWLRAQSKDEVLSAYALEVAEQALAGIGPRLGWPADEAASARIGIELYPSVASLAAATGLSAQAIETSGTIAVCKEHRLLLLSPLATASGYDWADTLAHELTHLIVGRQSRNRAPVWLQEGLAKTYEAAWRGPPGPHMARATQRRMRLAARQNELIPLARMHPSVALLPSQQQTALAFAEVSSLLDGIRRRVGDAPLAAMLRRLAVHDDFEAAWQAPLLPVAQEERRWRRHLERLPLLPARGEDDEDDEQAVALAPSGQSARLAADSAPAARPSAGAVGRWLRLGELLALAGRWPAAAHAYQEATREAPRPDARIERAWARALTEAQQPAQAIALWRQALQRRPAYAEGHYWLGVLLADTHACPEAVVHLRQFCLHNPFVPQVHEAWARCAEAMAKPDVAAREARFAALCRAPRRHGVAKQAGDASP